LVKKRDKTNITNITNSSPFSSRGRLGGGCFCIQTPMKIGFLMYRMRVRSRNSRHDEIFKPNGFINTERLIVWRSEFLL